MVCVYFDFIKVLLQQISNELELGGKELIISLIYGECDNGSHNLFVFS